MPYRAPLKVAARAAALATVSALLAVAAAAAQTPGSDGSVPVSKSLQRQITHVPASVLNKVGPGTVDKPGGPFMIEHGNGAPLTTGVKPEFFSYDFEWCPHCMATSWALVVALSRFGKFGTLRSVDSGTYFAAHNGNPPFSNTPGFSFLGVPYSSRYLVFDGVEGQNNMGMPLAAPSPAQSAALQAYDKQGIVPFEDFANNVITVGEGYSPGVLAGLGYPKIAAALSKPKSAVARDIDGLANVYTAAICKITHGKPANVCKSKAARAGGRRLAAG